MIRSRFLYPGFFLAILSSVTWGVEPIARLSGPTTVDLGHEVILSFNGTVSEGEPEYDVASAPEGSSPQIIPLYNRDQNLTYGIVVPDKPGLYRFAVIASVSDPANRGQNKRKYAFLDVSVVDQSNPLPGPPPVTPPGPTPPPGPVKPPQPLTDTYGFYTLSRQLLALMPNTPGNSPKSLAGKVADIFSSMADKSGTYQSAQQFVTDTSSSYKSLLGVSYPFWSQYYIGPIKVKLTELSRSGQLPQDVASQAEVWREIAAALREVR